MSATHETTIRLVRPIGRQTDTYGGGPQGQPLGMWKVTCSQGCNLGLSARTWDRPAAERRGELHTFAQDLYERGVVS